MIGARAEGPLIRRETFLPFSRPTIRQQEIDEVVDSLESGWITTGPKCERLEQQLAAYVDIPHALLFTSATAALHVTLMALELKPGDEVITSSMTWASTINMIELLGGTPVFVDIDRGTHQLDAAAIAAAVTERTVGIIPVHFAGAACDMDTIMATAQRHRLWVVEDAAHGMGTRYRGRHVGTIGEVGIFSFHPIKNMTTAEGGCIALRDEKLATRLRTLRFHGLAKSAWNRYAEGGTPQVEVVEPGFKYNMPDIQAALGLQQLASLDQFNARRAELVELYQRLLADVDEIDRPQVPSWDHHHTWHLYIVKSSACCRIDRAALMQGLKSWNVGTGIHFRATHVQPYYAAKYPQWVGRLPETEWVSDRCLSLPLFPKMEEQDVRYVVDAIKSVLSAA